MLEQLGSQIKDKRANIEVKQPLPEVLANASLLEQVLYNLLTNALKFVNPGAGPEVVIWAEERERTAETQEEPVEHERVVRICIKDNGIGIAKQHHRKVFGVFEKLHDPEAYPGTGMGLAIVEKAIQRMGGRVGVDSDTRPGELFLV